MWVYLNTQRVINIFLALTGKRISSLFCGPKSKWAEDEARKKRDHTLRVGSSSWSAMVGFFCGFRIWFNLAGCNAFGVFLPLTLSPSFARQTPFSTPSTKRELSARDFATLNTNKFTVCPVPHRMQHVAFCGSLLFLSLTLSLSYLPFLFLSLSLLVSLPSCLAVNCAISSTVVSAMWRLRHVSLTGQMLLGLELPLLLGLVWAVRVCVSRGATLFLIAFN